MSSLHFIHGEGLGAASELPEVSNGIYFEGPSL